MCPLYLLPVRKFLVAWGCSAVERQPPRAAPLRPALWEARSWVAPRELRPVAGCSKGLGRAPRVFWPKVPGTHSLRLAGRLLAVSWKAAGLPALSGNWVPRPAVMLVG